MSKTIKGVLIDPEKREITEVDVPVDEYGSCLDGMYQTIDCSCVDCARKRLCWLPGIPEDDVWFDDEYYMTGRDRIAAWMIQGFGPIGGRGLILGCTEDGESVDHTLTPEAIEELRRAIRWGRRQ